MGEIRNGRKRIGLILRVFVSNPGDIGNRIELMRDAVERAQAIRLGQQPLFARIDILVWADKRFKDTDCGQTASAMRETFKAEKEIVVSEVRHGDLFCALLNYGVALQLRHRIDYSVILSNDAFSYLTQETMDVVVDEAERGALVVGVAINELTQSILEGRVANTFAMWDGEALMTVGGFNMLAAKPPDDRSALHMKGWHKDKGVVYYHLAGVEEIIPLIYLVSMFSSCIAAVLPRGEGVQQYVVPDKVTQRDLWERHTAKMGTKTERQGAMAAMVGADLSFLKGGLMPPIAG